MYWWEQKVGENVFIEITRRDDIGADLRAPSAARGGVGTASYALVSAVNADDIVIRYDSRQEAIVGVSVATGPAEPAPIYWVTRGSYARRAGERPRWLPGVRVPLDHHRELASQLPLAAIQAEKDVLLELRARIQATAMGQPIYFPWIPYQDTLRTFQSYLVKMPWEAISLFPSLRAAVERAEFLSSSLGSASPVEQAYMAVDNAAGKTAARSRSQGFQLDQAVKVAVEAHAMNMATEFYAASWTVIDVHGRESYDLICQRGKEVKYVGVNETTTAGGEVILTYNEVRHVQENLYCALFVLSDVKVQRTEDGAVAANGGACHLYDPWNLDDGILTPIGYRYQGRPDRLGSLARLTSRPWRLVSKPMMETRNLRSLVRMCASQSSYPMVG